MYKKRFAGRLPSAPSDVKYPLAYVLETRLHTDRTVSLFNLSAKVFQLKVTPASTIGMFHNICPFNIPTYISGFFLNP